MTRSLAGKRLLITSGPTRADVDAVRYISNRSTGRLGARIATEALRRGAHVALVAGPGSAAPQGPQLSADERGRLRVVPIVTVPDLLAALEGELRAPAPPPDAVLHAMAVLDYVPEQASARKTPSGREAWHIRLVPTPKVIRRIKEWAPGTCLVEFKLEVDCAEEDLRRIAIESLRANRADLVVANDLTRIRDGEHPALIIAADGTVLARPDTKGRIAAALCDALTDRLLGA